MLFSDRFPFCSALLWEGAKLTDSGLEDCSRSANFILGVASLVCIVERTTFSGAIGFIHHKAVAQKQVTGKQVLQGL